MLLKQEISVLQRTLSAESLAIVLLGLFYFVGIAGILTEVHPDFILLTPINLLVSLGIVMVFHPIRNQEIRFFLIWSYFIGFGAELYGVQTGQLFGEYIYGQVLGPKIWGTPLMIGANWVLLSYSIGVTTNHLFPKFHWLPKGLIAALLMVGLDVIIEPVAIKYNFWSWSAGVPPLQNYVGWFLVSLPLLCIFTKTLGAVRNKVAIALFILQILFFLILNLL